MSAVDLRVDWCSHEAAKYAVEKWHYSRCLPSGKIVKVGIWEEEYFIGCVLFSWGANPQIGSPYNLNQVEVCELTRVALSRHIAPVSKIVALSIGMLKLQSPGLRLITSYADPTQEHVGIIYQAMNWVYAGLSVQSGGFEVLVNGKWTHLKTIASKHGTRSKESIEKNYPGAETRKQPRKHKYLYPLDRAMRKQIAPLAKPYPKRESCGPSVEGDTLCNQPESQVRSLGAAPLSSLEAA